MFTVCVCVCVCSVSVAHARSCHSGKNKGSDALSLK